MSTPEHLPAGLAARPRDRRGLYLSDPYISVARFDHGPDGVLVVPPRRGQRR